MSDNQNNNAMPKTKINLSNNLKHQSLGFLVKQFDDIGNQSQILQGLILIEINARCYQERCTFDEYVEKEEITNSSLCTITHQHRTRLMNLAKFFTEDRPMEGISITAGYEISAPKNSKVAVAVYNRAVNQNYPVKTIQEMIRDEMSKLKNKSTNAIKISYTKRVDVPEQAQTVIQLIRQSGISDREALVILKTCYLKIQEDMNMR